MLLETVILSASLFLSFGALFTLALLSSSVAIPRHFSKSGPRKLAKPLPPLEGALTKIEEINETFVPKSCFLFAKRTLGSSPLKCSISEKRLIVFQELSSLSAFLLFVFFGGPKKIFSPFSILLSLSLGILLPVLFVKRRERVLREAIEREIPFFADLLTLSCEAGMDVFASLMHIVENLSRSPLCTIVESILKEVQMGNGRHEVLKEAYRSSDIWDLKTIFMTVMQAENLGTPIGRALRNQVEVMRQARMNRAEKLAQEAPLKLLIPLLFCIFPVTFITLLSPLILKFMAGEIF